ncbi:MAG: hypothetical protein ACK4ND_09565 [Cytophagaceae bacterium]
MKKMTANRITVLFAILFFILSCKKKEEVNLNDPNTNGETGESVMITDETVELSGKMHGVMKSGKTYKLVGDLYIEKDREILMESGVRLESTAGGVEANESYSIFVYGSFVSLGTEANPNWITTTSEKRTKENFLKGYVGTIEARETAKELIFKWTHLEYLGGPSGPGSALYDEGETMKGIRTLTEDVKLIVEDSWFFGSTDDAIRPDGGKISILRNTFEAVGGVEGEGVNVKGGTVGSIAYNVFIGGATNGPKTANSGGKPTQANVDIYNNTILTSGFRRVAAGRGGSINIESGARGKIYNNLIVNCRFGTRVVSGTDYANTFIDYNWYFGNGTYEGIVFADEFYPTAGVIPEEYPFPANDFTSNEDPMFVSYNVNQFSDTDYTMADQLSIMPYNMNMVGTQNLRLATGSPCINAGYTGFTPVNVISQTGVRGANVTPPSADLGAYPTNGTGNRHN